MDSMRLTDFSRGGGCGCKIEPAALHEILAKVPRHHKDPSLLVGIENSDDAAVFQINSEQALVFTNDFFTASVDDPYTYGRIAAANALSDIYAMGGEPLLANAIVGFPVDRLPVDAMQEIMRGGVDVCQDANIPLAGGHSIDNPQPIFGLAAVGTVHPKRIKTNAAARAGDLILLTKPLGVGVMASAFRTGDISEEAYARFIDTITILNKPGAWLGSQDGVHGMTDVTGFGLAGHLLEMARGAKVRMLIDTTTVPILEGAREYAEEGLVPSGAYRNIHAYGDSLDFEDEWNIDHQLIYTDPQTNGGLLVTVAADKADEYVETLRKMAYADVAIIGEVVSDNSTDAPVVFRK